MRVSSNWLQQQNVNLMTQQQSKLHQLQVKIASGQKYLTPSENTTAATENIGFNQAIDETAQYQENITMAQYRLSTEDKVLGGVVETIQRLKELGLQGITDVGNSALNRTALAAEFDELNKQLLGLANTKNANGEYLFAGLKTNVQPYEEINNATQAPFYQFVGTQDQRAIQVGQTRRITEGDSALAIFGATANTVAGSNGRSSIFDTVRVFSEQLKSDIDTSLSLDNGELSKEYTLATNGGDFKVSYGEGNQPSKIDIYVNGELKQTVSPDKGAKGSLVIAGEELPANSKVKVVIANNTNQPVDVAVRHVGNPDLRTLNELDEFLTQVTTIRSSVGARLNALDNQFSTNADYTVNMKTILSQNADLDYTQAVTDMSKQQTSLEAAQNSFTKVQNLSLFKYL